MEKPEEEEPFLRSRASRPLKTSSYLDWVLRRSSVILIQTIIIIILFVLSTASFLITPQCKNNSSFPDQVYSPAQSAIAYKNIAYEAGFGRERTQYQGPPSPEVDNAWDSLYSSGLSRIPKSEAARLANKTVPIPDDPGYYIIALDVFHQFHCLNAIRLQLWSSELLIDKETTYIEHIDHCLDSVRQSLMCSSEIAPRTWEWDESKNQSVPVHTTMHTCRDYDKIVQWAKENQIKDGFDPTIRVGNDL